MAYATSQSWLLEAAAKQITKLEGVLQNSLDQQSLESLKDQVDIGSVGRMLNMAQEATLDIIDLQAREVVNARVARHHMWLQQTRWTDNTKARLLKAPISGDGKLCGDI